MSQRQSATVRQDRDLLWDEPSAWQPRHRIGGHALQGSPRTQCCTMLRCSARRRCSRRAQKRGGGVRGLLVNRRGVVDRLDLGSARRSWSTVRSRLTGTPAGGALLLPCGRPRRRLGPKYPPDHCHYARGRKVACGFLRNRSCRREQLPEGGSVRLLLGSLGS